MDDNKDTGAFYFDAEGELCAGNVRISDFSAKFMAHNDSSPPESSSFELVDQNELVPATTRLLTPLVVYSKKRLLSNLDNYKQSFRAQLTDKRGIDVAISYSLKANFNPSVLKLFRENHTWVSLVNKNELKLALRAGFRGPNLIFNGNGKKLVEIELAIKSKCFINIDSVFNLSDTLKVAARIRDGPAKVLLRVNVSASAQVHSYLDTSGESKFGIESDRLDGIIEQIKSNPELVSLAGFHIHLGSTIKTIEVYRNSVANLITLINSVMDKHGVDSIEVVNFGGGLGIDYERFSYRTNETKVANKSSYPTPRDLAELIGENVEKLHAKGFRVVVEPGRSLVGDSAILLTSLIGVKRQQNKNFLVVDASMCECIRPCLYSAYHHIDFVKPGETGPEKIPFDVVGPVCESGDFLGKGRYFGVPREAGVFMAVMDVGAYCSSMANNYNLHQRPAEVFIDETQDGVKYLLTRRPDTLDDILAAFVDY